MLHLRYLTGFVYASELGVIKYDKAVNLTSDIGK